MKFADTQKEKEAKKIQQINQNLWNISAGGVAGFSPQYITVSSSSQPQGPHRKYGPSFLNLNNPPPPPIHHPYPPTAMNHRNRSIHLPIFLSPSLITKDVKDPSVFGPQIIVYIRTEDQSLEEIHAISFVFHLISFPDI